MATKGFFGSLFDFSFTEFVTPRIVKVLFVLAIVGLGIETMLILLFIGVTWGGVVALLAIILAPLVFFLYVLLARVWLEVIIVWFRIAENTGKLAEQTLEKMTEMLEKNRSVLAQINQNTRLSETARAVAFRDADRQALREAVFDKLHQQDFDTTYEIIDEIAHLAGHQELAEQLHAEADKYRDATDQERANQVIAHIEKLFEAYQWAKASAQVERLIKAYPNSEEAKEMRQRLLDKKEERKKILLAAWDEAVERQATDRSLEILKELDLYLTPNEGLALQEAARDVFRNKLHSLGVQFSLAVSEKQWAKALETGQQIIHDFPNSRMAEEIREKVDVLRQKVEQHAG